MDESERPLDGRQRVVRQFAELAAADGRHFFAVLLREPLEPQERIEKYENPLRDRLGGDGIVVGGGSQRGAGNSIESCGLDVIVQARDRGLFLLRSCLKACGADPDTTVIEEYVPTFRELEL